MKEKEEATKKNQEKINPKQKRPDLYFAQLER